MPLTLALPRERRRGERRVALVPAAVSRLLARAPLAVRVEESCGRSAGFHDTDYAAAGAEFGEDFARTVEGAALVAKVGVPTLGEIAQLAPGTVLVSLTRAFLHREEVSALAAGGITTVAMDLVPRTARARAMDAVSSQATVAGYKAALLAAELSPRLFPMMTTAAGTIRPSRVVVIGAGVAGLQAIATARRLGAEVEAYDIRKRARERIESLGARMIDTGVEATDAAGHARALRRDEQQHQHDVLAEHLARAHAVICAASIPNRPAPRIVTSDMVEHMLPDTVIVDMAAATGGNCELTRPGEHVQYGDTLVVGPLNLPSQGAVHASEMYARNVVNLLELLLDADGRLLLDEPDDIVARCVLTHAGDICHASTAALMDRPARPFGSPTGQVTVEEEDSDAEAGWASEAPDEQAGTAAKPSCDERRPRSRQAPIGTTASDVVRNGDEGSGERTARPSEVARGTAAISRDSSGSRGGRRASGAAADGEVSAPADAVGAEVDGAESGVEGDAARDTGIGSTASGPGGSESASEVPVEGGSATRETAAGGVASEGSEEGVTEPPPDDLTVIRGIGPALQGCLYAFGITRLAMLAELDEPGRRRLAVQLELDEEIEEGDWAGQARALLASDGVEDAAPARSIDGSREPTADDRGDDAGEKG